MKSLSLHVGKVIGIFFLTAICLPSFSQVRSLKAMNDTIDLYPGISCIYDILANDSIPVNDTVVSILGGSASGGGTSIQCQKTHDTAWK